MSKDELSQRSRELDRKLRKDFDSSARVIKLLLLGTGSISFYSNYSRQATVDKGQLEFEPGQPHVLALVTRSIYCPDPNIIEQGKLFQRCTHFLYCTVVYCLWAVM